MPYQEEPNTQLCTFDTASDLAARLNDIGVKVETIYEIDTNGEKVDTTDDRYVNDGQQYQYVAKIWDGPEQNLGITDAMFKSKGYNWGTFEKLATAAGKLPVEKAIIDLHGCIRAINANLEYQMK
jgi:hypothetical protein